MSGMLVRMPVESFDLNVSTRDSLIPGTSAADRIIFNYNECVPAIFDYSPLERESLQPRDRSELARVFE